MHFSLSKKFKFTTTSLWFITPQLGEKTGDKMAKLCDNKIPLCRGTKAFNVKTITYA